MFVLRTGCQWKALSRRNGLAAPVQCTSAFWSERKRFFKELWRAGLAEYNEMEGIAWLWQSIDGAMMKPP